MLLALLLFWSARSVTSAVWQKARPGEYEQISTEYPLQLELYVAEMSYSETVTLSFRDSHEDDFKNYNTQVSTVTWSKSDPRGLVQGCTSVDVRSVNILADTDHQQEQANYDTIAIVITNDLIRILTRGKVIQEINAETSPLDCVITWWAQPALKYVSFSSANGLLFTSDIQSTCPPSHPHSYNDGFLCCEVEPYSDPLYPTPDEVHEGCPAAGDLEYGSPVECCPQERRYSCHNPPCYDYLLHDIPDATERKACLDERWDPLGLLYRGKQSRGATRLPCLPWKSTQMSQGIEYDKALGIDGSECRNPDMKEFGPWCYVQVDLDGEPTVSQDLCVVTKCSKSFDRPLPNPITFMTEPTTPLPPYSAALRLYNPTASQQLLYGSYGPENAIDGDFFTFLMTGSAESMFNAWLSPDLSSSYRVTKIIIYTVRVLLPLSQNNPYYTKPFTVTVKSHDRFGGIFSIPCNGDNNEMGKEKYVFTCPKGIGSEISIAVADGIYESLVLREVEVYGEAFKEQTIHSRHESSEGQSFTVNVNDANLKMVFDKETKTVKSIALVHETDIVQV